MPGFLQEVAADLYDRYGDDISSLSVLFPSRRARLFFIDALSGIAERPLWQPRWTTIDELMSEISGLRIGDRVRLVTELYKVYSEFHPESFDKFYFWGEMLLTDFDTIDKYLIDADMLFRNLFLQIFQNCRGGVDADIPHYKNLFQLFIKFVVNNGISGKNGVKSFDNIVAGLGQSLPQSGKKAFLFFCHPLTSFLS